MTLATDLAAIRSDLAAALARVDALISTSAPERTDSMIDVVGMDRTKAIEWVLEQQRAAMRPVEIWAELARLGRSDPKMEVRVTTFDLWQRRRIGKVGRGQYISKAS